MNIQFDNFKDDEWLKLVNNRWASSSTVWDEIEKIYSRNTKIYENNPDWAQNVAKVRRDSNLIFANRIFVNMESVINSLIANPPGINLLPAKGTPESRDVSQKIERFIKKKISDRQVKETMRMAYRNLYFARLGVIKAFWNSEIDDWDFRSLDPRKVRIAKSAKNAEESEFVCEELTDSLCGLIERFPEKRDELLKKYGFSTDKDKESEVYIKNPEVTYKETWIGDYVVFTLGDNLFLGKIKNPYFDFEGVNLTEADYNLLKSEGGNQEQILQRAIKGEPSQEEGAEQQSTKKFFYNYFETVKKPYIIGTIFNNENKPIGRTDMITLASTLQQAIDRRKSDIAENAELVNGIIKVDSKSMSKSEAQQLRWQTKGIIWGNNVSTGVIRETGSPLPAMVFEDMVDSRQEIDNIMAASSAFRGERQGQETKAGRLALIQQSYLRLNELVQLTDAFYLQIFSWAYHLSKLRYTENRYVNFMGKEGGLDTLELMRDQFEEGQKFEVIAGKTLPVDDEFKFEQAQNDVKNGYISPVDYLEVAQYDNPKELSKNAVAYKINPIQAVGFTEEEVQKLQPSDEGQMEKKAPSLSIKYEDLPPDAQGQVLSMIGVQADPEMLQMQKIAEMRSAMPQPKIEETVM